jgi:hypothetical protein
MEKQGCPVPVLKFLLAPKYTPLIYSGSKDKEQIYIHIHINVCVQLNLHTLRQIGLRFHPALHSYKREYLVAAQSENVFLGSILTILMPLLYLSTLSYSTILN